MQYIKPITTVGLIIIGLYIAVRVLTSTPDYELNNAQQAFVQGDYSTAQSELDSASKEIAPYKYHLYQAYLDRADDKLKESTANLKKAEDEIKLRQQPALQLEIALNLMLNAYLEGNREQFKEALQTANALEPFNPWVVFFRGLNEFQEGKYEQALASWQQIHDRTPMSLWMKKSFDEVFTPQWMRIQTAKASIESGRIVDGRRILLDESTKASGKMLEQVNFLIGYSYAKEGFGVNPEGSLPYLKLALPYLKQVPLNDKRFDAERQALLNELQTTVHELISNHSPEDVTPLIEHLQTIPAPQALAALKQQLLTEITQALQKKNYAAVESISKAIGLVADPQEKQALAQQIESAMNQQLQNAQSEGVQEYWAALQALTPDQKALLAKYRASSAQEIQRLLPSDNAQFSKTRPYLGFWFMIEQDPVARETFAQELLKQSEAAWAQDGQSEKAAMLMNIALNLSRADARPALAQRITSILEQAFVNAVQQGKIDKLPAIANTAGNLKIPLKNPTDAKLLGQILNEADYYASKSEWDDVKKRAEWVLLVQPKNERALKLLGWANYYFANYPEALKILSQLPDQDYQIQEAVAVSQILAGNPQIGEAWIAQQEKNRPISRDAYMRLALGTLLQNDPEQSLRWLSRIGDKDGEVLTALAYANYLTQQWQEVVNTVNKIKGSYAQIDGVQALAIRALMKMNRTNEAEQHLESLLASPQPPGNEAFSPSFIQFREKVLSTHSRYFVAGMFYEEVEKNPVKASEYFALIEHPSPEELYQRGRLQLVRGLFANAMQDLVQAARQNQNLEIKKAAIPLLAQTYLHAQRYYDAFPWYQALVKLNPENIDFRRLYAFVLLKMQRYDLALEQYQFINQKQALTIPDEVRMATAFTFLGRFDDANDWMQKINNNPQATNVDKLEAARNSIITGQQYLFLPAVETMWEKRADIKDLNEVKGMLALMLDAGGYGQAKELVKTYQDQLQADPSGLILLAEFNRRFSRLEKALNLANQALELDPNDDQALEFVSRYETNQDVLHQWSDLFKKKVDADPTDITASVNYVRFVERIARLRQLDPKRNIPWYAVAGQNAAFIADRLANLNLGIPKIDFLNGQGFYLVKNFKQAVDGYQKALKLDPSYPLANIYYGLSAEQLDEIKLATDRFKVALIYAPYDADAWEDMARLATKTQDYDLAIDAYQQMIKFAPDNLTGYLSLAKIYLELKSPENAKLVLESAAAKDPQNAEILSLLLRTLYDISLYVSNTDMRELARQKNETFSKLYEVDPEYASKLLTELNNNLQDYLEKRK